MKKCLLSVLFLLAICANEAKAQDTVRVYYRTPNMIAVPGEELLVRIAVSCDSFVRIGSIHDPLATDNDYIELRTGGERLAPLSTWDDVSFLNPDFNQPIYGWTSQSMLAWAYLTDPPPTYFDPRQAPTIAQFKMMVRYNPAWEGQQASICTSGYNWRNEWLLVGDSSGQVTFPTKEDFQPVTFRLWATGTGTGVMGNQQNHIDSHYSGGYGWFRLQDITRRSNINPHGHNGQMPGNQSIATYWYDRTINPGDTIFDMNNTWDSFSQRPAVDAQVYAGKFYDYLLTYYQRNSYDSVGSNMISTVEDSTHINNSYWHPDHRVVYGIAGSNRRSWAGCPEAVAHEFSHGITQREAHLLPGREAGAIEESFGNMMGVTFRYVLNNRPSPIDWTIGANAYNQHPSYDYEMSMSDPHGGTRVHMHRPEYYQETGYWYNLVGCNPDTSNDYCGIHTNSGVPDKMFYFLSVGGTSNHNGVQVTSIGIENAMKVMYMANEAKWWYYDSTFIFARRGCIEAARVNLNHRDWAIQTANAWNAVGVCDSCVYMPGDVNNNGQTNGLDVTYLKNYLYSQGPPPPISCTLPYRQPLTRYVAGDYNGDCEVNGLDVTYGINYFKGFEPEIRWCPDFTPGAP